MPDTLGPDEPLLRRLGRVGVIHFVSADDAQVEPDDDGVVAMVDA